MYVGQPLQTQNGAEKDRGRVYWESVTPENNRPTPKHSFLLALSGPRLSVKEGTSPLFWSHFSEQHCPSQGPVLRKLTQKEMKSSETGQDVKYKL